MDRAPVLPRIPAPFDRRTLDHPYFEQGPRSVGYLLVASLVLLPLLVPSGPGNTALADVGILARRGRRPSCGCVRDGWWSTVPYLVPMLLLMIAGLLAAYVASAETAALAVVQDLFCLVWAAAIANAVWHRRWLLELVLRAWVWSGIAWASVMCFGRMAGINWLAGITAKDGGRASLTFDDPNLAANYFLVIIGLLLATSVVRQGWLRFIAARHPAPGHRLHRVERRDAWLWATMAGVGVLLLVRRRRGVLAATALATLTAVGARPGIAPREPLADQADRSRQRPAAARTRWVGRTSRPGPGRRWPPRRSTST